MSRILAFLCVVFLTLFYAGASAALYAESSRLTITPSRFGLRGKESRQQLIVTGMHDGRNVDWTSKTAFRSATPEIVAVDKNGLVTPVSDGVGIIVADMGGQTVKATVQVRDAKALLPVDFERHVQPLLTAAGCNAGACHGKQGGQNGFQLSLLGFDDDFDFAAIAAEGRGRRVFPASPQRSLLLRKPSAQLPHGGGRLIQPGGRNYEVLRRWIVSGMPRKKQGDPVVESISVFPAQLLLPGDAPHRLLVTAHFSDGTKQDVTGLTAFQSNESAIVKVDRAGVVRSGSLPGETTIMARFMYKIATCKVLIPLSGKIPDELYENLPRNNFIDGLVWDKLQRLGITPSQPAGDAKFLRRATIDVIGRTPTADEVRAFLADNSPQKRERLIDRLLQRPEYADHWANKWVDLLRPNPYRVGIKAVLNYDGWIRDSFRKNKPYDQFVRELLTAQGSTWRNGAVTFFRDRRSPVEITTMVSQLFLGIRLECAKCHHHPFEAWGQKDFYSFAAYFSRIGRKGRGLSPPISGSEEILFIRAGKPVKHPRTGEIMTPRPLFGEAPATSQTGDLRQALADWMTSKDNPYFAAVMVNRVWADLMGRGIVEPVDDLRSTNPPTNGPLLKALAADFVKGGYDIKKLIKRILTSYVYGLESKPNARNVSDTRNYSRHYRQRLRAEVLLDSISAITGVPEKFPAMPPGSSAKEIWTHRISSLFLDTFGRPDPNRDPPCDRTGETAVVQTLHLMNGPQLHAKITSDSGRAAKLAASKKPPKTIVEDLYRLVYARPPTADELRVGVDWFSRKNKTRREAAEDLLWALINTPEFVFKD